MSEQQGGAQKNQLGELFVQFTTKGLPSLLKNLNSVSASFLLGKNAANQFAQTITKPFKDAGRGAVEVGKLASSFGATKREIMQLQIYLQKHNLSEGLIGDLGSVSDMLTKVKMGIGGISGEFAYAMHSLGLNWTEYDGSIESMSRLANDVRKATQGMNAQQAKVLREAVGLKNQDWSYAFERGDINFQDYKTISEKEIDELIAEQEAMKNLETAINNLKMHLVAELSPGIKTIADKVANWANNSAEGKNKNLEQGVQTTIKAAEGTAKAIGKGVNTYKKIDKAWEKDVSPQAVANKTRKALGLSEIETQKTFTQPKKKDVPLWIQLTDFGQYKSKGQATGGAAPATPSFMMTPQALAPTNNSNIAQTNTIQITNQNTINGTNANAIKDSIISINENDINYSQYQVSNMAGL